MSDPTTRTLAAELSLRSDTERDALIRQLQQELRETQARVRQLERERDFALASYPEAPGPQTYTTAE